MCRLRHAAHRRARYTPTSYLLFPHCSGEMCQQVRLAPRVIGKQAHPEGCSSGLQHNQPIQTTTVLLTLRACWGRCTSPPGQQRRLVYQNTSPLALRHIPPLSPQRGWTCCSTYGCRQYGTVLLASDTFPLRSHPSELFVLSPESGLHRSS